MFWIHKDAYFSIFFPVQTLWKNPEYLLLGKISAKCGRCKQWCILQQLEVMHYISIHTHTTHTLNRSKMHTHTK